MEFIRKDFAGLLGYRVYREHHGHASIRRDYVLKTMNEAALKRGTFRCSSKITTIPQFSFRRFDLDPRWWVSADLAM